MGFLGMEPE